MKLTETQEKVLAFIGKFSDSTADAIAQGTGVQNCRCTKRSSTFQKMEW